MINKNLVGLISRKLKIPVEEFIEKDIILQATLIELAKDNNFSEKYAFKGGTCLIKCYFGYYRFSEDLDFTLIDGKEFVGKSEKVIRKMISEKIDLLGKFFEEIAKRLDLDFKAEKNNKRYIEFGGSNKFTTFKLYYNSSILDTKHFIKIQINFVENFFYNIKKIEAKSLVDTNLYSDIKFIYPEYSYLNKQIKVKAYDVREIFIEKIRAILTRRGIKRRDFIDAFLIFDKKKINLEDFKGRIISKIEPMLKYEKYHNNLKAKKEQLRTAIELGNEEKLMLKPLDNDKFSKFIRKFIPFLLELADEVKK